jgi:glycosyltransferase involved in cell wall biosynthesis
MDTARVDVGGAGSDVRGAGAAARGGAGAPAGDAPGLTAPARILVFQNRFLIGGQERQTVLNVRTMDRSRFVPVVACLHREGEQLEDLAQAGVRPVLFDVGRRMLRPRTALEVARLARLIRAERIVLVHAQDIYTNALGLLAARAARVPVIATRVDLGHHVVGYRRPLTRLACRAADRVLVNALCVRDLVIREGVEPDRVVVVRNGVDLEALDREAREAPASPPPPGDWITCVANMHHPVKGQTDLLVAFREALRAHPGVRLLLVGDGVRRPLLEKLARELGVAERVHFLGFRRDVPALLARAVLSVSASHAEGLSNAILEAMASRLPVVATAVGGTPELVRDGVTGLLAPPGSPGALSRRMIEALADPARARRMGERGRRLVEREFDLAQMRLGYDALYDELAAFRVPRVVAGMA